MRNRVVVAVGVLALVIAALIGWRTCGGGGGTTGSTASGSSSGSSGTSVSKRASKPRGPVKPASLSGRVVDKKDKRGIAGAVVSISRAELINQILKTSEASLVVVTDAQGVFTLSPVLPGTYFLAASALGYVPGVREKLVVDSGDAQTGLELALDAGGSLVTGTVSDLLGGPIANARVTAKPEDVIDLAGSADLVAITKDDGTYQLTLAEGEYELHATHDEYTSAEANLELTSAPAKRDFVLTPGGVVRGQVIARDSGEPVGGAWLLAGSPGDFGGDHTARGDEQGNFVIRGLRPGALAIRAQGPGYASVTPTVVELGIGEQVEGVRVLVDRAFSIYGNVVRKGKPDQGVPGIQLGVFSIATQQFGLALEPTDDEGAFAIHGVRAASYMLFAGGEGNVPELGTSVEVVDKDVTDVKVEMATGVSLSGRVEPAQAGVRITLELTGGGSLLQVFEGMKAALVHGETDATGAFTVANAPVGPFTLIARAKSGDTGTLPLLIGETDQTGLVVKLETRASIAGRVVNDKGQPVAEATVEASPTEDKPSMSFGDNSPEGITRADGSFKIVGLEPGTYKLRVEDNEQGTPLKLKDKPAPIELAKGQARTNVVLTVEARDGVIKGIVLGADKKPVPDAWVTAQRDRPDFSKMAKGDASKEELEAMTVEAMDWEPSSKPVLTGADGRFTIGKLRRNGTYKVIAEGPRGNSRGEAPAVKTGTTSVTITLLSLGTLRGKVTDAAGKPVTNYDISCDGPDDDFNAPRIIEAKDGAYTLERLAPGAYECNVTANAGEASGKVDVPPGDATLDFKLAPWGVVTGKVVDVMTKKPVKGVNVMSSSGMGAKMFEDMVRGKSPKTDESGIFTLDRVKPGEGTVSIMQNDLLSFAEPLASKPYKVASGQRLDLGTIEIVAPREGDAGTFGFACAVNDTGKLAVTSVKEGGPAFNAGMKEGDIITAISGMTIGEQLSPVIAQKMVSSGVVGVGIPIQLTLDRAGSPITMSLVSIRW